MTDGALQSREHVSRARAVFFGTPSFAVPALRALAEMVNIELSLVVTQPDRPAGRHRKLQASPVKRAALVIDLPVYQPPSLRAASVREYLASLEPDVFVVAAYGQIFGPKLLAVPSRGCLNLHASLLPAYRGASPVCAAILAGDTTTGVSLMVMDSGLDTGPVVAVEHERIAPDDTTETLTARLAETAAHVLVSNLEAYLQNEADARPQAGSATTTRPLAKVDGWLDWSLSAEVLERHVRAMWPWPRAWTTLRRGDASVTMQVHAARVVAGQAGEDAPPGRLVLESGEALVYCGRDRLSLTTIQMAGSRPQPGATIPGLSTSKNGVILGEDVPFERRPPLIANATASPRQ
jgi:methionyl-tRNA formyltransferase